MLLYSYPNSRFNSNYIYKNKLYAISLIILGLIHYLGIIYCVCCALVRFLQLKKDSSKWRLLIPEISCIIILTIMMTGKMKIMISGILILLSHLGTLCNNILLNGVSMIHEGRVCSTYINKMNMENTIVYTSNGWGPCKLTKSWLRENNINFIGN